MTWREQSYNAYILGVVGILGCLWLVAEFPVISEDPKIDNIFEIVVYGSVIISINIFIVLIVGTYKVSFNHFGVLKTIYFILHIFRKFLGF